MEDRVPDTMGLDIENLEIILKYWEKHGVIEDRYEYSIGDIMSSEDLDEKSARWLYWRLRDKHFQGVP